MTTTALPYSTACERSLHQTFIFSNRLYVLAGWRLDGNPLYSDVYHAPILSGGALGSFVQTTSLPMGMASHSATVSPDGKVYVASGTNLFLAQIAADGSIGSWGTQPTITGMNHNNYGNTGMAVMSNLLVIVDYTQTFICQLNGSGQLDSTVATITNPAPFTQRSVYAHNGKPYVTATTGKIYRIDGLPQPPAPATNRVLSLDGSGDYVSVPSAPDLQNPTEITLEAWVRADPAGGNVQTFLSKSDGAFVNTARTYELVWVANGGNTGPGSRIEVNFFVGTTNWALVGTPVPAGQWVHVAATYRSSDGLHQLFTNGVLAASATSDADQVTSLAGKPLRQTSLPLYLGKLGHFSNFNYANGKTDEVRIWSKARTPDEIYRDRYCTLTGTEPNLAGYWTFDDGTATDQTGHGHNGTFAGDAHVEPVLGNDPVHAGVCGGFLPYFFVYDETPGGGFVMPDPFQSSFAKNSFVVLTALPFNGWTFLDWQGAAEGTNPVVSLQMGCDKIVAARFGTPVTGSPSGSGTVSMIPSSALYPYGTTVRITAHPGSGSYFTGWSGGATGDDNPLNLNVRTAHPVIFVSFGPLPAGRFALTVASEGSGQVSVVPPANSLTNGETVTNTAMADAGQEFLGWSGDAAGTNNPLVVVMNESKFITASFTKRPRMNIQQTSCDGLLLNLSGEYTGSYRIESSPDLTNWSPYLTVTNVYGESQFMEPSSTNQTRFYRAVTP